LAKKQYNIWAKLRSATRAVWMYSPQHREALKAVQYVIGNTTHYYAFKCPLCKVEYPMQMASIDHQPPCGSFDNWQDFTQFCVQLFEGPVRVICKLCHKSVTSEQRRRKK
jgi:hypothetical protein